MRLNGVPFTPEFMAEYQQALNQRPRATVIDGKVQGNTWRWLCQRYFAECTEYKQMELRGQGVRRRILETTFDEPLKPGSEVTYATFPLERLTTRALRVLRDRKLTTPEGANNRVKAIRAVCKFAIRNDYMETNPAKDLELLKHETDGYHTWTIEEVTAYQERHPLGTRARLALDLLLYTGVRRSDVVKLGPQHIRAGWLNFKPSKTRKTTGIKLDIPVLPPLAQSIEASAAKDHLAFLMTERGKPFTANGFGNYFKDCCRAASLDHCSAHGLRKAGATFAAENGATTKQLMAMYGWSSVKMAEQYTRAADQKRLAGDAMHLISAPK